MVKIKKKIKGIEKLLYAVLIGLAVVGFWRGAWGIMDELIFKDNYLYSSITTLVAGIIILILTHKVTKELM